MPNMGVANSIDGKWFLHKFGEMRAYFGDFLAVCDGNEFKHCRVIQYGFGPNVDGDQADAPDSFFGNSRLAVQQDFDADGEAHYTFEIFSTKMPYKPNGPMTISIDGKVFQLGNEDWNAGSPEGYNVVQTFSITDPSLTDQMVAVMKAGNRMRVLHDDWSQTWFQLRGFTRALEAIKNRGSIER